MTQPYGFSWIEQPYLAALARPGTREELQWLRDHGIDVLLTLTEDPVFRRWINESGLLAKHVPIPDMTAPTQKQIEECIAVIQEARKQEMGVAVHCAAGKGRTGTILACYLVAEGQSADQATKRIRELRPGSIEVREQEEAIHDYARRQNTSEEG